MARHAGLLAHGAEHLGAPDLGEHRAERVLGEVRLQAHHAQIAGAAPVTPHRAGSRALTAARRRPAPTPCWASWRRPCSSTASASAGGDRARAASALRSSRSSTGWVMKPISTSAAGICTPASTTKGACFTPREGPESRRARRSWAARANSLDSVRCSFAIRSPRIATSGSASAPAARRLGAERLVLAPRHAAGVLVAGLQRHEVGLGAARAVVVRGVRVHRDEEIGRARRWRCWCAARAARRRRARASSPRAGRRCAAAPPARAPRRARGPSRAGRSRPRAPSSSPPWPASITTVSKRSRLAASRAGRAVGARGRRQRQPEREQQLQLPDGAHDPFPPAEARYQRL